MAISSEELRKSRLRTLKFLRRAGIVLSTAEKDKIEVVDFGMGDLERTGIHIFVYVNTPRYCAKELVLFPGQTCAEHRHPSLGDKPGKQETFRCRWGEVYLCVPGEPTLRPRAKPPGTCYTVFREIILRPGDQYTLLPDTLHWFQAGPKGAVVSEFSSQSVDEKDVFTDPRTRRHTLVIG